MSQEIRARLERNIGDGDAEAAAKRSDYYIQQLKIEEDARELIGLFKSKRLNTGVKISTPEINENLINQKTNGKYSEEFSFLGITFTEGDIVTLLPGRYHINNGFIGQTLGAFGIKNNRTLFNNTQYLKCRVVSVEESTSFLGIAFGPSDPGKSHNVIYQLRLQINQQFFI